VAYKTGYDFFKRQYAERYDYVYKYQNSTLHKEFIEEKLGDKLNKTTQNFGDPRLYRTLGMQNLKNKDLADKSQHSPRSSAMSNQMQK